MPPSVSSGGASSDAGSETSGASLGLGLLDRIDASAETGDLLRGNATSKKEVFFSALHFIYKDRWLPTEWRYVALASVLQWVQLLILFFGPTYGWDIDWRGNPFWRFYVRLQLQNTITERGYNTYQYCLYGGAAVVLCLLAIALWLHFALRSRTKFRIQWPFHVLRVVICVAMTTLQTSYLMLFTVGFDCNSQSAGYTMYYFPDRGCFEMPSTALFAFSIFMALVFEAMSLLFSLIEMGATDWTAGNYFSLSAGGPFLSRRVIKFVLPLVHVALKTTPRWMGCINFALTTLFLYITVRRVPFHRLVFNLADALLYSATWWAAGLGLIGIYYPEYWSSLTLVFLVGVGPIGVAFAGLVYLRLRHMWRVAALFERWTPVTPRRETHRFLDEYEVEVVARVCQALEKSPTLEMVPVARWVTCAENVLRAGLVQFPDSAYVNILMGTFQAVLRAEASGGLQYLQRARKCPDMNITQRFQVFVREQEKLAQKGRGGETATILDASSWAELNANYRQVVKCHKEALVSLKAFWQVLTHSDVSMNRLVTYFGRVETSRLAAERAYKTVMERYPNNSRVMRAFSRFLSQVKNDPHGAARYAASAARLEEAHQESRREALYQQIMERDYSDAAAGRVLGMIDEALDAVVLINHEGRVQYVNGAFLKMFEYRKGELEGGNVASIMPPPFSQQHDGYLHNYVTSRVPRVLDRVREVVALHRKGHVFPVQLCVTPVTMGGAECFMGVIKPQQEDPGVATIYCTGASGLIVCVSRGTTDALGYEPDDLIGQPFHTLCASPDAATKILASIGTAALAEDVAFENMHVTHKYGDEQEVAVGGRRAGTDAVRVAVIKLTTFGRYTGLLCVNSSTARITFANQSFCDMVKIPNEQIIKMRLHELMPEPYNQLHQRWLKGRELSRTMGVRCRSGRVVEFKHGKHGNRVVPALLDISERATDSGTEYLVRVCKVQEGSAEAEWNRLTLSCDAGAVITATAGRKGLFPVLEKEELVGQGLDAVLDIFRRGSQILGSGTAVLSEVVQAARDKKANSLRVAVAPRGKRSTPAVMSIVPPPEGAEGAAAISTLHIYRTDAIEGVIELDSQCKIKRCSEEAGLLLGVPSPLIIGTAIQVLLPGVAPGGQTTELMAAPGQRGGSKRSVGPLTVVDCTHADGKPLSISMQVAESVDRPGRFIMRLTCPKGTSSSSLTGDPAAAAAAAARSQAAGAAALADTTGAPPRSSGGSGAAASGCPFHRSGSGGGSLMARMMGSRAATQPPAAAMAASPPGSRGGCPFTSDTQAVLASLSFPANSQYAEPGAVVAVLAGSRPVSSFQGSQQRSADPVAAQALAGELTDGAELQGGNEGQLPAEGGAMQYEEAANAGLSAQESMSVSEQDAAEAQQAAEDDIDPEELKAKMELVQGWLAAQHEERAVPGDAAAADVQLRTVTRPDSAKAIVVKSASFREAAGGLAAGGPDALAAVRVNMASIGGDDISSMGSEQTMSVGGEDGDDAGADLSRLKRYKKAFKLLSGTRARQAVNTLQRQLKYVLMALVLVHVGCFVGSVMLLQSSVSFIKQVDMAGNAARYAISMCADARAIQWAGMEMAAFGESLSYPPPNVTANIMLGKLAHMEQNIEKLYFLKGADADKTRAYMHSMHVDMIVTFDVDPPFSQVNKLDLWTAVQRTMDNFKDIAALPDEYIGNMTRMRQWRMIMMNVAIERLHRIIFATWGFLAGEGGLVIPLAAAYLYLLLRAVAAERFNLYSLFLFLPRAAVLALAKAEVHVDELDEDSDDDDDDRVAHDAGGTGVSTQVSARIFSQKAAQDKMGISRRAIGWLMAPFGIWLVVVVVVWMLQFTWTRTAESKVMTLDASERLFVYQARVKHFAQELASEGTFTSVDTNTTLYLRDMLRDSSNRLRFWHEAALYGSDNPLRPLENVETYNTAGVTFMPTLFTNPARHALLFSPGCYRVNQSACPTPDEPEIYWTTQFGLSNLLYYFAEQADLLAEDDMEAIRIDHHAIKYIQEVATDDLSPGLAEGNRVLLKIDNFTYDTIVQGIALAFIICGTLAYFFLVGRPYIRRTQLEAKKVAEMISYLPQGVDVAQLMTAAGVGGPPGGKVGSGGLSRSLSRSSDGES